MIETPEQAESLAAEWMRQRGYRNVRLTARSADHGIDVLADDGLAQVKLHGKAVPVTAVRQLFGARGHDLHKALLFFAREATGYTAPAMLEADKNGVALFTYDLYGQVKAVNRKAREIEGTGSGPAFSSEERTAQSEAEWGRSSSEERTVQSDEDWAARGKASQAAQANLLVAIGGATVLALVFSVCTGGLVAGLLDGPKTRAQDGWFAVGIVFFGILSCLCWAAAAAWVFNRRSVSTVAIIRTVDQTSAAMAPGSDPGDVSHWPRYSDYQQGPDPRREGWP